MLIFVSMSEKKKKWTFQLFTSKLGKRTPIADLFSVFATIYTRILWRGGKKDKDDEDRLPPSVIARKEEKKNDELLA